MYKFSKLNHCHTFFDTIPNSYRQCQTRNSDNIPSFFVKHDHFKNRFFSSAITEWKKLDCYISNVDSFFKNYIKLNHLKERKFKHNFQGSIDGLYSCSSGIETKIQFFLDYKYLTAIS